MALTDKQKRYLKGLAHPLNPVVWIGHAGLTDAIVREAAAALEIHELIKIKARAAERTARNTMLTDLATRTGSELVNRVGHVGTFYRPRPKLPKIVIPDA
jgi:RNA-binding protein